MDVCWILAGLGLIFGIAKFLFSEFDIEDHNIAESDSYDDEYNMYKSFDITSGGYHIDD